MWRMSDLVECVIFVALALMLVYTAFVTVRFFRRYFLACRDSPSLVPESIPASQRTKKNLVAELSRGVGALRSIAAAAPFLGLAGACYGILLAFFRSLVVPRGGFISAIALEIPVALVATGAGIIAAIPAAISYNVLRTRLEKFEVSRSSTLLEATPRSYGFAQTLPLRGRFSGMPAYALIAAPVLALLIPIFALMLQKPIPVGLPVRLLKMGVTDHDSASIVISVIGSSASGQPAAYMNSKEIQWNDLGNTLRSQLKLRPHWSVYVAGEDRVAWRDVVNAIDVARGLDAEVVLLTAPPTIEPSHSKEKTKRKLRVNELGIRTGGKN
jgi:biopolymer transport protein ExbD